MFLNFIIKCFIRPKKVSKSLQNYILSMEFKEALNSSKEEFKKMAELQNILSNVNETNLEKAKQFINTHFDLNNHSSIQKLCYMIGIIAGIKPTRLSFLNSLYKFIKPQIDSILDSHELFYYPLFEIMKNFEQSKPENENEKQQGDTSLYNLKLNSYIENDNLDLFQSYLSQTNTKPNTKILQNRFYSNKPINSIELIEYAALCGSTNIFKFLLNQLNEFPIQLKNFAVAGGNHEIIHIVEQTKSNFTNNNLNAFSFDQGTLETAIEFHSNDIVEYLIESHSLKFDSKSFISSIMSNNFIFMNKYIKNEELVKDVCKSCLDKRNNNDFDGLSPSHSIFQNISFIEFSFKIKSGQISIQNSKLFINLVLLNYDSVSQLMVKYWPKLVLNHLWVSQAFIFTSHLNLYDAIIVYIQFLIEKNSSIEMIKEIFKITSNFDNKLTDVFLNLDDISIDVDYQSLLYSAITNGKINFLNKTLNNKKIDVNKINSFTKMTPLIYAYGQDNIEVFKYLLCNEKVDVNMKDGREGATVLHHACYDNNIEVVKLLLELKSESIDVNATNYLNQTPLHLAAIGNNIEIVELLVKSGKVDIEIKDNSGVSFIIFF